MFFLGQCARQIDIDLPVEPPKFVVVSHFTTSQPIQANISLSRPVYDDETTYPSLGISLSLASDGTFLEKLELPDNGEQSAWSGKDFLLRENTYYTITISGPGFPEAKATSFIPSPTRLMKTIILDSMVNYPIEDGKMMRRVKLRIKLKDVPDKNRFFAFNIRGETQGPDDSREQDCKFLADGRTFSLLHETSENVILVNENYWMYGDDAILIDALVPYDPQDGEYPSRLFLEWRTLSPEFYKYHLSLSHQGNPGLPFNEPDALYNNVIGGYGNFSGYSSVIDTVILN